MPQATPAPVERAMLPAFRAHQVCVRGSRTPCQCCTVDVDSRVRQACIPLKARSRAHHVPVVTTARLQPLTRRCAQAAAPWGFIARRVLFVLTACSVLSMALNTHTHTHTFTLSLSHAHVSLPVTRLRTLAVMCRYRLDVAVCVPLSSRSVQCGLCSRLLCMWRRAVQRCTSTDCMFVVSRRCVSPYIQRAASSINMSWCYSCELTRAGQANSAMPPGSAQRCAPARAHPGTTALLAQ